MMTDDEINNLALVGEITLILERGTAKERESLLSFIAKLCGEGERARLERWIKEGCP